MDIPCGEMDHQLERNIVMSWTHTSTSDCFGKLSQQHLGFYPFSSGPLMLLLVLIFLEKNSLFGRKANSSNTEKPSIIYTPQDTNGTRLTTNSDGIYQNPNRSYERTSDVPRSSDNPGYADLGVKTLGASGSMPRLNESFDSMDERNFNRPPKSRNHSSFDDGEQFYPSRYHKVTTALNPDTTV